VLCGLPSLHLGGLRISRGVFLGHGGDEAAHRRFGTRGRGRLQISESERAEVIWHGGEYEEQVVQELREVPLGNRVLPIRFFL
jgi:hypothetical protein